MRSDSQRTDQIFIACLFKGSQEQSFFLQTLLFTAFLVTVLKKLTYALVSKWSSVSSGWEHLKRKIHPCRLELQTKTIHQSLCPNNTTSNNEFMIQSIQWIGKKGPEPHLMQNITWRKTFTVFPLFCKLSNPSCYRKCLSASEIRLKMTGNSCCVIQSIKSMKMF